MIDFPFNSAWWNWSSPVWLVAIALAGGYIGLLRDRWAMRSWWFLAGMAILLAAFISPIGVLANGYLFSAHMLQHLLLLLVVPLCLLLSLPKETFAAWLDRSGSALVRWLSTEPKLGWICGLGAMWIWHVPALCSAATEHYWLGAVRSTTFLLAGLMFWWPIYSPVQRLRLPPPAAVVYLFSACLGCTLLGIYITFTTISVCPAFANPADRIGILTVLYDAGLSPAADQQLGGLLMWVPPCSLYVCAVISVLCRWYAAEATMS